MTRVERVPRLRARRVRAWIVCFSSLGLLGAAETSEQPPPEPLTLAWCLERAQESNPDLDVARSAVEVSDARVYPSGAWEDPRFTYEASNLPVGSFDFDSTPLSGNQLGLRQRFPFPGLLGSRREAAGAAAEASIAELADRSFHVAAAVEEAWVALGFTQRALEVTIENIDLLRQLSKIAEAKYRVGEGLQQDVIRAQVALTELLDERLRREAAIRSAESRLASLLDLSHARFPRTTSLRDSAALPDLQVLLDEVESTSPRLRALAQRVDEAEHRAHAAKLEGYPEFDLGVGYRIRKEVMGDPVTGDDFVSFGVTVRLPVDRKRWRAEVAEQDALLRKSQAEFRKARATLRDTLRSRYADLERSDQEIALLEDGLLPQSQQSLDASRSGYEVDKVDFPSLVDAQVSLFNAQLRLERAIADRRAAFAAVEATVGAPLR